MFRAAVSALTALCALSLSASVEASQEVGSRSFGNLMMTEARTMAPLSFVQFCMSYDRECAEQGEPDAVIRLTPETLSQIERVNREVNRGIRPVSKHGTALEKWTISPASGDCNDYAVTKRHRLVALGLPSSALLLATAMTPWGEGHLLVILRTEDGDLVLDNLVETIRPWNRTGYRWIARQSSQHPRHWEAIAEGNERIRFASSIEQAKAKAAERRALLKEEYRQRVALAKRGADIAAGPAPQSSGPPITFVRLSLAWEALAPRLGETAPWQAPATLASLAGPVEFAPQPGAALPDGVPSFSRMPGWASLALAATSA